MTENEFWRCTPRKVMALWDIHGQFNNFEVKDEETIEDEGKSFIDEIPFL